MSSAVLLRRCRAGLRIAVPGHAVAARRGALMCFAVAARRPALLYFAVAKRRLTLHLPRLALLCLGQASRCFAIAMLYTDLLCPC